MATKKNATNKKGKLRNLPRSKKELTSDEAKGVKGGLTIKKLSDAASPVFFKN
jgi:hypothetical protein